MAIINRGKAAACVIATFISTILGCSTSDDRRVTTVSDHTRAMSLIRAAVVQIRPVDLTTRKSTPLGTGFFVNRDGHLITALHVLDEGLRQTPEGSILVAGMAYENREEDRNKYLGMNFVVVGLDETNDLALLRLTANPAKGGLEELARKEGRDRAPTIGVVILDRRRPTEGARIAISGFPFDTPVLITNSGWLASAWYQLLQSTKAGPRLTDVYIAAVGINPGNSGGPVYLVDGAKVIGVAVAKRDAGERFTYVVPARYIVDLMQKHGVRWSE